MSLTDTMNLEQQKNNRLSSGNRLKIGNSKTFSSLAKAKLAVFTLPANGRKIIYSGKIIKEQPEEKQEDATNTEVKKYKSNIINRRI